MIRASERIWALVSGYAAADRAQRLLAVFQTYTDDSGRGDPKAFLLAGLVSTAPRWAEFSDEWQDALVGLQYFKMQEAASLHGQFSGYEKKERDLLVIRLFKIIAKHIVYGVREIVDVRAWHTIALGKYDKSTNSPYLFSAHGIITTVMQEQYIRGLAGTVDFIFDYQSPREFKYVRQGWELAKSETIPEPMPRYYRRRMGQPPICLDDKITMPLQAADLLAWCRLRQRGLCRNVGALNVDRRVNPHPPRSGRRILRNPWLLGNFCRPRQTGRRRPDRGWRAPP
jgi:hypothetical protein